MMDVNLGDMETSPGEQEEYWLIAIRAAQEAVTLMRQHTQQALHRPLYDGHCFRLNC